MPAAKVFHPLHTPVQGTNLIEASAGTGKTWNIAALFLRLVVLENHAVDKILVVTFTKAAAAELKTRLRSRLDDALLAIAKLHDEHAMIELENMLTAKPNEQKRPVTEPFVVEVLLQALRAPNETASRLRLRLQAAINQFDQAGIFTIHGFCQRVLREFAFLCQLPFQVGFDSDTDLAQQRLAGDFWRKTVLPNATLAQLCVGQGLTPNQVLQTIKPWLGRRQLAFQLQQCEVSLDELVPMLDALASQLQQQLPTIISLFIERLHPRLNGSTFRLASYQKLFATLQLAADSHDWQLLDSKMWELLNKLTPEVLTNKLKKNAAPLTDDELTGLAPLHLLATYWQQQSQAKKALQDALHHDMYVELLHTWQNEKQRLQQLGFDDLLVDVADALRNEHHGKALAQRIGEQMWQVALIDEFQDTDPLQYGIFDTIFRQQNLPLFLVGDPKQAIYRFRGADIHAYLQAKHDANEHYTLETNHRTHARLVRAVNALFLNKAAPFVLPDIDYIDVAAARPDSNLQPNPHPLQMQWLMQDDEETLTKSEANKRAAECCALDIANQLSDSVTPPCTYKGEPLQAKHFAVLVRSHFEGELIQRTLRQHNIMSVILSKDSVFASSHAKAVLRLLKWWLQPQQQGLLRNVLSSELLQLRSHDVWRLNQVAHQDELIAWMEDAHKAQALWRQRGIFAAWQMFDLQHGISRRFLQHNDKRGLTNVQQLFDLLAQEASNHFGAEALLQWFSDAVKNAKNNDSAKLRLESDEALVKIVTMHSSKGLQYPIVYCPFVWNNRSFDTSAFNLLHDSEGKVTVVSEACLSQEAQNQLLQDDLSEQLRLLYVALTRAEEKLVLSACLTEDTKAGDPKKQEENIAKKITKINGLNYLITPPIQASIRDVVTTWEAQPSTEKNASDEANFAVISQKHTWFRELWQHWAEQNGIDFLWRQHAPEFAGGVSTAQSKQLYQAAKAHLPFYRMQEYTSFSGISRHISHIANDDLAPELDSAELQDAYVSDGAHSLEPTATPSEQAFNLFAFQRGTEAGLCMHELLEYTDFAQEAQQQYPVYQAILERYQIAPEWHPTLLQMIDATRLAHLDGTLNLAQLERQQYLPEMGFVVRVDRFAMADLLEWLVASDLPQTIKQAASHVTFRDISGFLNGFIDLTCVTAGQQVYVIDYKSNHLGNDVTHYRAQDLDQAIIEHRYYLQALIYAIAVARYLHSRGIQFDGIHVRYLFLRGLQAYSGQGIWRWDIGTAELEKLTPILLRDNINTI